MNMKLTTEVSICIGQFGLRAKLTCFNTIFDLSMQPPTSIHFSFYMPQYYVTPSCISSGIPWNPPVWIPISPLCISLWHDMQMPSLYLLLCCPCIHWTPYLLLYCPHHDSKIPLIKIVCIILMCMFHASFRCAHHLSPCSYLSMSTALIHEITCCLDEHNLIKCNS